MNVDLCVPRLTTKKINFRSKPLHLRGRWEFFCSSDPVWSKLFSLLRSWSGEKFLNVFFVHLRNREQTCIQREKKNKWVCFTHEIILFFSHIFFFFFFQMFSQMKKKRNFEWFSGFSRHLPTRSRVIRIGEKITLISLRNWITRKKSQFGSSVLVSQKLLPKKLPF